MEQEQARFTPGPWSIRPNNGGRFTLLEQQTTDPTSPEARANARLIAAAPHMYKAMKRFVNAKRPEHLAVRLNDEEMAAVEGMRAALKKARGEA